MQKAINSQAMIPTKKPQIIRKSDTNLQRRMTNHTTQQNKGVLGLPDSVKEDSMDVGNECPFKDHPFYSQGNDLASSFSYSEGQNEHQYEKLLFAKFLQSHESEWMTFMHDMRRISQQKLIDIVKIGQSEKDVVSNRLLAHYIGVWLISMGYRDIDTRKRVIMNVQYIYPEEKESTGQVAGIMFQKLFQGYLPQTLQLKVLFQVCKRGWEYLAFFIGNFIKILRKHKNIKEQLFLDELQTAIK